MAYIGASSLGKTWSDMATIVTSLPRTGALFQYNQDGSLGEQILAAFNRCSSSIIEQWVASVPQFSSYRTLHDIPNAYHPINLIGPPASTTYGDAPGSSWCPATTCNVAATSPEFVVVRTGGFFPLSSPLPFFGTHSNFLFFSSNTKHQFMSRKLKYIKITILVQ